MKNETFTPERIKAEADAFFEWDGEDRSLVTTTSCLLFAQHIAGLMQARSAQPAPVVPEGWRAHSAQFARGVKCPQNVETLQAAWDRDQELIEEQRAEISRLSQKLNQARQGMRTGFDLDAWLEFAADKQALIDEISSLREQLGNALATAPAQGQQVDAAAERNAMQRQRDQARNHLARECDDADAILRIFGIDPDEARTDGGFLNISKVRELSALKAQQVGQEPALWARQCDLDESDPALFVSRERVEESGYTVPFYPHPTNSVEGEPVGYTTTGMLAIAKELPLTGRIGARCKADERWNVPLYTAPQQAPAQDVAVPQPDAGGLVEALLAAADALERAEFFEQANKARAAAQDGEKA